MKEREKWICVGIPGQMCMMAVPPWPHLMMHSHTSQAATTGRVVGSLRDAVGPYNTQKNKGDVCLHISVHEYL